jgi:4-amino-4-deoxy-L-arabinose transferase-like glycosyltransferase
VEPSVTAVERLPRAVRRGLWVLLVVVCLQGVFGHSLWGSNDAREGGMIWDMVRNGAWVTPTLNGKPFLEKPPLLHWTGVVICRVAGRVTEGLIRLPAALYGFGTLVLLFFLVRGRSGPAAPSLASRELAAWAAVFLCSTAIEFHEYSRIVLTDMALTFMVMLSLFVFLRAFERPSGLRWLGFLACSAAAFYAKGLIGPALIWCSVGVFLLWRRRFRLLAGLALAYLPILAAVVAPWVLALAHTGGEAMVRFVFWDNQVGRFFSFADPALPRDPFFIHKEPVYYYLSNLPIYLLPWTLLLPPAALALWRRHRPSAADVRALVGAALIGMFVLLHLSAAKVAVYALPAYPFLFAMVGLWLIDLVQRRERTRLEVACVMVTAAVVMAVFVMAPTAVVAGTFVRPYLFRTGGTLHTLAQVALALGIVAGALGLATALRNLVRSSTRIHWGTLAPAGAALLTAALSTLAAPVLEQIRSVRPFVELAASQARLGTEIALATAEFRDIGTFTFYLNRRLPNLGDGAAVPDFLAVGKPRAVIIAREELGDVERALAGQPHSSIGAGRPKTNSAAYALVLNSAAWELAAANGIDNEDDTYRLAEWVASEDRQGERRGLQRAVAPSWAAVHGPSPDP